MAIYALRPLSTGEILDGALTLLRRHFRLVLWIALAFEGVPTVMDVYLDLAGGGGDHPGLALLDRILSATGAMLVTGATVRVEITKNPQVQSSYPEPKPLTLVKRDGAWKVDVTQITREMFPYLPQ